MPMCVHRQRIPINNKQCVLNVHFNNSTTNFARGSTETHTPTNNLLFFDGITKKYGTHSGDYDGSNRYTSYPDSADWDVNKGFALSCWIMFDTGALSANAESCIWDCYNSGQSSYYLEYYHNGAYGLFFQAYNSSGGGPLVLLKQASTSGWTNGVWYHVAVWYYKGYYYMSRDGVILASHSTTTEQDILCTRVPHLGNEPGATSTRYFKGWLDDFQLYKYSNGIFGNTNFRRPARAV